MLWELTGESRNAVPIWKAACDNPRCRMSSVEQPTCDCWCRKSLRMTDMPCVYRNKAVTSHGCCGTPVVLVYGCDLLTACTLNENDGTLEWRGQPVVACINCPSRSDPSQTPSPQD